MRTRGDLFWIGWFASNSQLVMWASAHYSRPCWNSNIFTDFIDVGGQLVPTNCLEYVCILLCHGWRHVLQAVFATKLMSQHERWRRLLPPNSLALTFVYTAASYFGGRLDWYHWTDTFWCRCEWSKVTKHKHLLSKIKAYHISSNMNKYDMFLRV